MILVIDNGDFFAYNIYQCVGEFHPNVRVVQSYKVTEDAKAIILSSGPGRAECAGECVEVVKKLAGEVPILGIGLGLDVIGRVYGCRSVPDAKGIHGKTSIVLHDGKGIFKGVKNPLRTARYYSFKLDEESIPSELEVCAHTLEGTIMAVRHKSYPICGLEFHPESIMTEEGKKIFQNFVGGMIDA